MSLRSRSFDRLHAASDSILAAIDAHKAVAAALVAAVDRNFDYGWEEVGLNQKRPGGNHAVRPLMTLLCGAMRRLVGGILELGHRLELILGTAVHRVIRVPRIGLGGRGGRGRSARRRGRLVVLVVFAAPAFGAPAAPV